MSKRFCHFSGILLGAAANMMMQTVVATILSQVVRQLVFGSLFPHPKVLPLGFVFILRREDNEQNDF